MLLTSLHGLKILNWTDFYGKLLVFRQSCDPKLVSMYIESMKDTKYCIEKRN